MQFLTISAKIFRKTETFIAVTVLLLSCCLLFTGCGRGNEASFSQRLALIDGYIAQHEEKDALAALKKAQDKAFSVSQRLSIVKRYRTLGDYASEQKYLAASVKKLPDSIELAAVYVQNLLAEGRDDEAAACAEKLKGTYFDSLYVEAALRQVKGAAQFHDDQYISMYERAYSSTGDSRWLRNSAALLASKGEFRKASQLHPGYYDVDEEPFFWALVDYDAGIWNRCIEACGFVIENMAERTQQAELLCSDAWLQTGDLDLANSFWCSLIHTDGTAQLPEGEEPAPAEIYKNAACHAVAADDYVKACQLLSDLTSLYPEYVPGLVAYVHFARNGDDALKQVTDASSSFRNSSMKTIQMEVQDAVPRIPLSDALYRLEKSLEDHYSPELLVEYTRVRWQLEETSETQCRSDLWSLLERTRLEDHYEPYMVHWAVCWLSAHHEEAQAESLFKDYLYSQKGIGVSADQADAMDDWECELAAWFALKGGDMRTARALYEDLLYGRIHKPSVSAMMNCASVYAAEHAYTEALELYSAIAPEIDDVMELSELQYRMGVIQYELGEKRNALLSLSYSVKLNPDNHRARLLLKQLQ